MIVPKIGTLLPDCDHAVAYIECVCAIPPIFGYLLKIALWVGVSVEGFNLFFSTEPSLIFIIGKSRYSILFKSTPDGLIVK